MTLAQVLGAELLILIVAILGGGPFGREAFLQVLIVMNIVVGMFTLAMFLLTGGSA